MRPFPELPFACACILLGPLLLWGCGETHDPAPGAPPGVLASALSGAPLSSGEPPLDNRALAELLGRVPSALAPTSASGTLVGTDSGVAGSALPRGADDEPGVISLLPTYQASSAGSERDLRATLYYDLTNSCRDSAGKILPPESVDVSFRIDPKGQIDRASVKAAAADPAFEEAARCMVRLIRASEARFTPPRLDKPILVHTKVPSID